MSKETGNKMHIFKKLFLIFMTLDFVELILVCIALRPMSETLAGYGQLMLCIARVTEIVIVATLLIDILAKLFLLRSTSANFSWASGRKGYVIAAKLLMLFNLGTAIFNLLAVGGEGATLINQLRLYLQILASAAEAIVVFCYLRTVKRLSAGAKEESK